MVQRSRDVIKEVIKGKSDDEIADIVANMGGGSVAKGLALTFQGVEDALVPEKAVDCVIGWNVTHGAEMYSYAVTIENKKATVSSGARSDARVTLTLSIGDYLRIIVGQLDGVKAFTDGTLKIEGDATFSERLPEMFGIA